MRYRVLPYKQGSKGAKALATALGGKVLRVPYTQQSLFKPTENDVVINWGNTEAWPWESDERHFNIYWRVKEATNKLKFFRYMRQMGIDNLMPRFWETSDDIPDAAFPIVCRTVLAGHSGDGIVISNTRGDLVHAPLYVEYIKKQQEYRIHVGMKWGEPIPHGNGAQERVPHIIAVQRKARRNDHPSPNWKIRNLAGGFVYVRQGVNPPPSVLSAAGEALRASGLDFGAVDVLWNQEKAKAYVLEINTAPGIEGQTIEDYANFFRA